MLTTHRFEGITVLLSQYEDYQVENQTVSHLHVGYCCASTPATPQPLYIAQMPQTLLFER